MAAKKTPDEILENLKKVYNEASITKRSIATYEKTAKSKTGSIEKLLTSTKDKITSTVDEFRTKLTNDSAGFKKLAGEEFDSVEKIRKDTKLQYNRFTKTYTAAMGKRDGVAAKHDKILALAQNASIKTREIEKNETKSKNDTAKVSDLLNKSRQSDREITKIHERSKDVSQEIENTYAITLDTTMAGTLVERRNDLKHRTKIWEVLYLISIGIIAAAIFVALTVTKPSTFTEVITERLVFVTPLIVVAFVLSRQFGHERKLYEEYAFKAASAQSLRGYTVLLNHEFENMPEARRDILDFTIGAMKNIYDREPLVQNPATLHLIIGNKLAKFEAKIDEKIAHKAEEVVKSELEKTLPTPQSNSTINVN